MVGRRGKFGLKQFMSRAQAISFLALLFLAVIAALSRKVVVLITRLRNESFVRPLIYQSVVDIPDSIIFELDAVIVLGGGASKSVESPPIYTQERCDNAAQVVKKRREVEAFPKSGFNKGVNNGSTDLPVLCLSAGTAHVPQLLAKDGLPVWESTSSASYLQNEHGLSNLFVETTSYDTIGNAFFSRTTHTDVNGWRNLLIITNEFHMARTKAIFDWIFLLVEPRRGYNLSYLTSKNTGLSDDALRARSVKEKESLLSVEKFASRYRTMKDVYKNS
ncbi:hypothetical protein ACA910_001378 [Epithemia clementina (nom. ined.)]